MHDIDRTLTEFESEGDMFETDEFEFEEGSELDSEYGPETEAPFEEAEEMEFAAELLSLSSEAELDQFIGKFLKRKLKGLGKFASGFARVARPLGGMLKDLVKKAIPLAGGALGTL